LIIADLKKLTAASEKDANLIEITGKANGVWEYTIPEEPPQFHLAGRPIKKKSLHTISQMRFKFAIG